VYTDFDSGAVQVPLLTVVDQHWPHYFMMGKIVGWSCKQKTHRHLKLPQIPRRIAFVFLSVCVKRRAGKLNALAINRLE
jgi:hypothetical protein